MVELWDSICIRKVPYTILSLSESAAFSVLRADGTVLPTLEQNEEFEPNNCKSVFAFGGRQVVVCRGEQGINLMIRVADAGVSEDFEVPMKLCPIKRSQTDLESTPTTVPTIPPITPGP